MKRNGDDKIGNYAILDAPYFPRKPNQISIKVVDSIMGSGKTTAMIQDINRGYGLHYLYVTPYLDEIDRVLNATRDFYQPKNMGDGKLESLHHLLVNGYNIVMTHALFLMATQETIELIYHGKYILVLDEALQTLHEYNSVVDDDKRVNYDDIRWLQNEGYIEADSQYNVTWKGRIEDENRWHYSEIQRLAKNGSLKLIDRMLYWEYPSEIFTAFQSIYVLTYLFENTILDAYLQMNGFQYTMVSIDNHNGKYTFGKYSDTLETRKELSNLVDIYNGTYNEIDANNLYAFSDRWIKTRNNSQIDTIKKAMRNYKNLIGAKSQDVMWTTFKSGKLYKKMEKEMGFKYTHKLSKEEKKLSEQELRKIKQFVPCNARATNDFSDRTVLMYMCNRYLNPCIRKYFHIRGYPLDEEQFARSEMLQWIWRSAIRNGDPIHIYIPSTRMRNLLIEWLGGTVEWSSFKNAKIRG